MAVFLIAAVLGLPLIALVGQVVGAAVAFPLVLLVNLIVGGLRRKVRGRY